MTSYHARLSMTISEGGAQAAFDSTTMRMHVTTDYEYEMRVKEILGC